MLSEKVNDAFNIRIVRRPHITIISIYEMLFNSMWWRAKLFLFYIYIFLKFCAQNQIVLGEISLG